MIEILPNWHPIFVHFTVALFSAPIIVWAYVRLAKKEEKALIDQFGDQYLVYMKKVPAFIPHLIFFDKK